MKNNTNGEERKQLADRHYVQALIETIRDPLLILDSKLRVVEANEAFYQAFKVSAKETEKKQVYELGEGQWNIPALKKLLGEVLPAKKIVKEYEVEYSFPRIGTRVMLLNANQIDSLQLILVAFEDITTERRIERKLTEYNRSLEVQVAERTKELSARVKELEELNIILVVRELKMTELKKKMLDPKRK